MTEPESKEHSPERRKRQPADEMLAEARQSIYELPDTAALAGVSALGDSIVDALTTEFAIEEVPAPSLDGQPAARGGKRGPAHAAPASATAASAHSASSSAAAAPAHASAAPAAAAAPASAHAAAAARGEAAAVAAPASPVGSSRVSAVGSPHAVSNGSTPVASDGSERSGAAGFASAGAADADVTVAIPRIPATAAEGEAPKGKPTHAGAAGNDADAGTRGLRVDDGDDGGADYDGSYEGSDDSNGGYGDLGDSDGGYGDFGYNDDEDAVGSPSATAEMESIDGQAFEPVVPTKKKRRHISAGKVVAALCILLALAVVGCSAYFTWDRWFRYDDAADIQGEWQTTNAQRTLVIDASHLKISEDVAYDYELDTKNKTITYSFGNSSGTATYRFSDDRQVLVIEENGKTDWMMALHLKEDPILSGSEVPEGISKLVRLSDDIMATPKSLDDTSDGTEVYEEPFYVGGYTEYTQTEKPGTGTKKDDDKDGDDSDSQDEESEDLEPGQDPDADYFDSERGLNFYYDDSQMLYYDQYGNYYYDMYGNNPYELPLDDGSGDAYVEESYYDYGYYEEVYY